MRQAAPAVTPQSQTAGTPPAVNLDEAELGLRYTMFVRNLDDDEDLQISRTSDAVVLSGIASSAERLRELQTALAGLPSVRLAISPPGAAAAAPAPAASQRPAAGASVPLLKDRLDSAFASADARHDFVNSCLFDSDSALSHAWALRRLAERYPDDARHALSAESQTKLDEMVRGHIRQIAAANVRLSVLLDVLPPPETPRSERTPAGFGPGIAILFDLVQRQDSVIAALIAGTQTTDTAASAADKFRAGHEAISRLTAALKP
jgi:hypothetical protein